VTTIRIERDYPHPRAKVWRALTDPKLMALWGMRPEGFEPVVGNRCRFVGEANRHWRGFVECEVLEVREPSVLAYSWQGNDGERPTRVSYTLGDTKAGTRLTLEHSGYMGASGFFLAKLIMTPGWRKTMTHALPALLADLDANGELRPESTLRPKF